MVHNIMKTVIDRKGFKWDFLFLGLIFILVGLFAFSQPEVNLYVIATVFGIVAILNGIWLVQNRHGRKSVLGIGILEILIGVLLLLNLQATAAVVPFLFAIWFIINASFSLLLLDYYKKMGKNYYWFALISSIVGIVLGLILLFHPLISMLTLSFLIGVNFLLPGIALLIIAFSKNIDIEIIDLNNAPENPAAKQLQKDDIENDRSQQDV